MRTTTSTVVAAALSTVVLAGCGGGNAYCDSIRDARDDIGAVSDATSLTVGDFDTAASAFEGIAAEAPEEVQQEWEKTASTLSRTSDALRESGAETGTKLLDAAQSPEFAEQAQELSGDLQAMGSDMQAISENVQSECDIDLNAGAGGGS